MDEQEDAERPHWSQPRAMGATGLVLNAASREKADEFLGAQIELLHLEREKLAKEDAAIDAEIALNLSHLRFRRFGDFTKTGLEIATGLLVLILLVSIGAVIWTAANDHGLVIDAFKVPPDMAEKGLTGDVIASGILDHLAKLDADTDSSRAPNTYSSDWGNDIKVEIPETGISITEGYRFLANWLGHQTHISGEVYHTPTGIALVTRVSGNVGVRLEGREADLDMLVGRAAESVYGQTQPYRYAVYVAAVRNDNVLSAKILKDLALSGPEAERPWAYSLWGELALTTNDIPAALYRVRKALELGPDIPLMADNVSQVEAAVGHEEEELRAARLTLRALAGPGTEKTTARSAIEMGLVQRATVDEELGDYSAAVAEERLMLDAQDYENGRESAFFALATDLAFAHDFSGSRHALGGANDRGMLQLLLSSYGWSFSSFYLPQMTALLEQGDWKSARAHLETLVKSPADETRSLLDQTESHPLHALLLAKTGDMPAALAEIAKSPLDCYRCLRLRGQIDATRKDWAGAAYWFARATAAAPSIPFAYADWGAMLLEKGDFDGAIGKFRQANEKGPHFADALEMWGEALMAQNRSDLALAKFAEANQYAPRWGRLHLKWGEALIYVGKPGDAARQFTMASGLDLTPEERSEFVRTGAVHG